MRFILFIFLIFITNCKFNKVVDSHGVHFLDKKQQKLSINTSNKNDIFNLLGSPSTKSSFNNDLLIYIETKRSRTTLLKFGKTVKTVFLDSFWVILDGFGQFWKIFTNFDPK